MDDERARFPGVASLSLCANGSCLENRIEVPASDEREVSADMRSATARLSDSFEERHSGGGLLFVVHSRS
jgi:hypothetical protein